MTNAVTLASIANSGYLRNRIINGNMVIDQRNSGASVTPTSDGVYTLDRWQVSLSAASKFSVQRSSTAPAGFINSTIITSLSSYSVAVGDYFMFSQPIEGLNVTDFGWGSASAQTVTLSFWVRSSLTGTFGGAIQNSAQNRAYPFSYTISSANTFEYKTVTIPGDTSGTWLTTNGVGLFVRFGLGVGSTYSGTAGSWAGAQLFSATGATSVVGTNGATFYLTGVQLEVGTQATPDEWRPYPIELQMCQRYCIVYGGDALYERFAVGQAFTTTQAILLTFLPVEMRAIPSLTTIGSFGMTTANAGQAAITSFTSDNPSKKIFEFIATASGGGLVAGNSTQVFANNSTANRFILSAEL
jgi:hypothetical protein